MTISPAVQHVITAVLTSLVTVTSSYFAFSANTTDTLSKSEIEFRSDLLETVEKLSDRVRALEAENQQLKLQQLESRQKILTLQSQLSETHSETRLLEAYLEALPGPAWIKRADGVMRYINIKYEQKYQVSRLHYVGKSDYEVYEKAVADRFRENDKKVYENKRGKIFKESITKDGIDYGTKYFWKSPIMIDGNWYIAGIGIEHDIVCEK